MEEDKAAYQAIVVSLEKIQELLAFLDIQELEDQAIADILESLDILVKAVSQVTADWALADIPVTAAKADTLVIRATLDIQGCSAAIVNPTCGT